MAAGTRRGRNWRRGPVLAMAIAASVVFSACGPLGDDDADPTATSEVLDQPTDVPATEVEPAESTESGVASETPAASTPMAPPVGFDQTPDLGAIVASPAAEVVPESTPVFNDVVVASPVDDLDGPAATPVAPPVSQQTTSDPLPEGDGTSGAFPVAEGTPEGQVQVSQADDPEASETPTSVPAGSPAALAASLDELPVETITSCDVGTVSSASLADPAYRTTVDVNVRSGPGADCEALAISPVGAFLPVTIVGGPVEREGEDFVWVQVEVVGETGWVVTDALEPVNP
jgi:hypothetical protein